MKRLDAAKSRLASLFDPEQRVELAEALLEDALELCSAADDFEWFVLTPDPAVEERAIRSGFAVIEDPPDADLNGSLQHAISRIAERGAESVTIVPCDAPLATVDELMDILDTGSLSDLVVVPADRDAGTNGLFLRPPELIEPRFGESSFSAYVRRAEAAKLRCSILPLPGLAIDVDVPEDIDAVLEAAVEETRSIRLLRRWREG